MTLNEKKPLHTGHRERLREEVFKDLEKVADYKLLEMLLTFSLPRVDTKPLAKRLLAEFGSLRAVLEARRELLLHVDGLGPRSADLIILMKELRARYEALSEADRPVMRTNKIVADMARARLKGLKREEVWALFVDTGLRLIRWMKVAEGTFNSAHFYPQEVIRQCLLLEAWGVMLVHNHPHGSGPTKDDVEATNKLICAAQTVGVCVLEHLIVTDTNYHGLREEGILPPLS